MAEHPQTIQIYLPTADPQGIRVASITTRIVQLIDVPRSLLGTFLEMPEANQVGVYFLFGEDPESAQPRVYIGQTGALAQRLTNHHQQKEFWNRVLVAVSLTDNLTSTHALFLEWLALKSANEAARYAIENANAGSCPHTTPPMEAECHELHDTLRVLMATLGYPLFEPLIKGSPASFPKLAQLLFCKASGADARGMETEEGFVVLKGSTGKAGTILSAHHKGYRHIRDQLAQQGVIVSEGSIIRFVKNHLFSSPSAAASCVAGRAANGLTVWKDSTGATLREVRETKVKPENRSLGG